MTENDSSKSDKKSIKEWRNQILLTLLSTIAVLFFNAMLNPIASSATNSVSKWWSRITTGISYSIPPDSILSSEDTIKLVIRNAKSIKWSWDDEAPHTVEESFAIINPPFGKGIHVLKFRAEKSDRYTDTDPHSVNYTVLKDAPTMEIFPQKTEFKPGETITINAKDEKGINHIGWVWDNGDTTTPEYSDHVTIKVPDTSGVHHLLYYAKGDSRQYSRAGWFSYRINVTTDNSIDTNKIDNIK